MISEKTNLICQKVCAWLGPVYAAGFIFFWAFIGLNLPPPYATLGPEQLMAEYYGPHHDRLMFGMTLACIFGMFYCIWSVQLTVMMWKRERVPVLALVQLCGGFFTGWLLTEVPAMWLTAAFLAKTGEVTPQIIYSIHKTAWFIWLQTYWITVIQVWAIGAFTLVEHGQPRIFPKWCGWIAILSGADLCLLTLVPWFRSGPFSIGGLVNFWLVYTNWIMFFVAYSIPMLQHLNRMKVAPELAKATG